MSTKARFCRDCEYYIPVQMTCTHPELADLVTGEPVDCHTQREMLLPPGDTSVACCGMPGLLWQAKAAGAGGAG